MKRAVKLYKGLRTDYSADTTQKGIYIDAVDIRITTDVGESQGSIANIKGNKAYFDLPTSDADIGITGTMEIIGATSIRDTIVFFTADNSDTRGWVFKLEYSEIDQTLITGDPKIIYKSNELNFSKKRPIEALGRFEGETVQRVYWTDYFNYFRSINIADSNLNSFATYPNVSTIDIFPGVKYTQPLLTNIASNGSLTVGHYQYSYRLITEDGKRTMISPPGNLIHIVEDSEAQGSTRDYKGDVILDSAGNPKNSNKATEITIKTSDYFNIYQDIELICSIRTDHTNPPQIFSIETKAIGATNTVFIHTGTENTIEELTLDEFTIKTLPFKTPKTLAPKDSSLVVANIRGAMFSVQDILADGETFDAKTGRYNSSGALPNPGGTDNDKLKNAFNVEINGSTTPGYNQDAHWLLDWHDNAQYKYQDNGQVLGGTGPNIKYKFHLERYLVDNKHLADQADYLHNMNEPVNLNDGYGNYANTTWDSAASPFHSGLLRGYKRGETYRFGIVFYDKKGNTSFVEYIGDIKFPDISEEDFSGTCPFEGAFSTNYFQLSKEVGNFANVQNTSPVNNGSSVDGHFGFNDTENTDFNAGYINTFAYALGIEFTITLPPSLSSQIESYQIVRVKREIADSKRLCTGIMKATREYPLKELEDDDLEGYDLRVNESDEVLHLFPFHQDRDGDYNPYVRRAFGRNGNWYTINNKNNVIFSADSFVENYPIYGAYIHFASADISYNTPGIKGAATAGEGYLLMTGRYGNYYSSFHSTDNRDMSNISNTSGSNYRGGPAQAHTFGNAPTLDTNPFKSTTVLFQYDSSSPSSTDTREDLGVVVYDYRKKLRTVGQVDKTTSRRAIQYIKRIAESAEVIYTKGKQDDTINKENRNKALGPYGGWNDEGESVSYYLRNFYTYVGNDKINLNNHKAYFDDNSFFRRVGLSHFYQGASGIIATLENVWGADPLGGADIDWANSSQFHYFNTYQPGANTDNVCIPKIRTNSAENANICGPIVKPMRYEAETSTPILDLLIPRMEVYGGFSQTALEANFFQPASPVISKNYLNPIVYGGDTFLNMWTFQESTTYNSQLFYQDAPKNDTDVDQEFTHNISNTLTMVTESKVNIALAHGATTKTVARMKVNGGNAGLEREVWRQENDNTDTDYANSLNMYQYSHVYSTEADSLAFVVKPAAFASGNVNDIRAYISEEKINEEIVDSWNKFGINDFIDVEDHGPINRIISWRDNVYYFQNTGVGVYSINPRAVTSTDDGTPTELGSAKGLQDFTYISNNYGAIHQWAVANTDTGIYSFDGINKKIFRVTSESNAPLSEIKGIHGLLKNLSGDFLLRKDIDNKDGKGGDNPMMNKGVHIAKDKINNEVIFTFLGTFKSTPLENDTQYTIGQYVIHNNVYYIITATYTSSPSPMGDKELLEELIRHATQVIAPDNTLSIVYDEVADEFSTRFSATPSIYLENGNILLSGDNRPAVDAEGNPVDNKYKIYQHNVGKWGEFYGVQQEMSIKLILNENADFNKILRTIEFNSIVRNDDKVIDRTQTITAFQVETEYQDTGKIAFSSSTIKRRFDKWRMKIPRDINNREGGVATDRLRSTYFTLTLYFDNSYDKELILDRILYYYDVQMF